LLCPGIGILLKGAIYLLLYTLLEVRKFATDRQGDKANGDGQSGKSEGFI